MRDVNVVPLGSLGADRPAAFATGPFGSAVSAKNFRDNGVPMLRGSNLSEDTGIRLDESDVVFVSEELANNFRRSIAVPGDLIFTCWGTVGQLGLIGEGGRSDRYLVSNKQMKMTPDASRVSSLYLYYYLSQPTMIALIKGQSIGSSVPGFNLGQLKELPIELPGIKEQQAIAEVLGALDDKIAANDRTRSLSRELARTVFTRAVHQGVRMVIRDATQLVARGVTPKYVDSGGVSVLNQKCVRDQRVNLAPARETQEASIRPAKLLQRDDVLVNSTGVGTLGRVARWTHDIRATVDSHITIVRFDPALVDRVCGGFALLRIEKEIEGLAEGSTGQTELRRDLLSGLEIAVPDRARQGSVGADLTALDDLAMGLQQESDRLAATRDQLLPLLMSGKVRVQEAKRVVEEVV